MKKARGLVAARNVFDRQQDAEATLFFQALIVEAVPSSGEEWARLATMLTEAAVETRSAHFINLARGIVVRAMSMAPPPTTELEKQLERLSTVEPRREPKLGPNGRYADQRWDGSPEGLLVAVGACSDDPFHAWSQLPEGPDRNLVVEAVAAQDHPRFEEFLRHCAGHPDRAVQDALSRGANPSGA